MMKPTHQILVEKIMETFKQQKEKGVLDMISKGDVERIYNEFLKELEEPTNSIDAVFEQATDVEGRSAIQDNAIEENRMMIRETQEHQIQFSKELKVLCKDIKQIKDFLNDIRLD